MKRKLEDKPACVHISIAVGRECETVIQETRETDQDYNWDPPSIQIIFWLWPNSITLQEHIITMGPNNVMLKSQVSEYDPLRWNWSGGHTKRLHFSLLP